MWNHSSFHRHLTTEWDPQVSGVYHRPHDHSSFLTDLLLLLILPTSVRLRCSTRSGGETQHHLTAKNPQSTKQLKVFGVSSWCSYFCIMLENRLILWWLVRTKCWKSHWGLAWMGQKSQPFFVFLFLFCFQVLSTLTSSTTAKGYLEHQNVIKIVSRLINQAKDLPATTHKHCVSHVCNCT